MKCLHSGKYCSCAYALYRASTHSVMAWSMQRTNGSIVMEWTGGSILKCAMALNLLVGACSTSTKTLHVMVCLHIHIHIHIHTISLKVKIYLSWVHRIEALPIYVLPMSSSCNLWCVFTRVPLHPQGIPMVQKMLIMAH